ncbi:MAG: Rab family GTPase [Candidatus Thorarchaeota archaeon]
MLENIIKAIVYTELSEGSGPNPILWNPVDLSEKIRMSVAIKSITMLTTDHGIPPKSLVIMPFPSFNLKGLVKYIERIDNKYKGGTALSTITLLFDEAHDLIFYKYIDYLESAFSECAQKVKILKRNNAPSDDLFYELNKLSLGISEILNDLHKQEINISELEAFPEDKTDEDAKIVYDFKIVICGDPGVGKTSTILRFTDDAFTRTYIPTLGVNISEKNIKTDKILIKLILWDIAGQIKFESMRRHFYKGAEGVILIFDLTNSKSFENITNWYEDVKKNIIPYKEDLIGFILGNKEDLVNQRKIPPDKPLRIAREFNLEYIETSALTGKNVEECFIRLAKNLIESRV